MIYLTNQDILPLGTVILNRISHITTPSEKEMGHMVEKVAIMGYVNIVVS